MVEQVSKRYWFDLSVLLVLLVIASSVLCFYAIPRWQHIKASQLLDEKVDEKDRAPQPKLAVEPSFDPQFDFYTELSKAPVLPVTSKPLSSTTTVRSVAIHDGYVLQLAAFTQQADAQVFADRLAILGYQAFVVNMGKRHKQLFRVCVGPYKTKEDASPDQIKLKKLHIASYLRKIPAQHLKTT